MKRTLCALCAFIILTALSGCAVPDSLQLDVSQGYGLHTKLLHLNASTEKSRQRIEGFASLTEDAQPLEKDISLFAYYPDLTVTITRDSTRGQTAVVDINGDYVDFHYLDEEQLYRSKMTPEDLKNLLHQPTR